MIVTNKDSATNFKLMECPLNKTGVAFWKTVIPTRNDVLIEGVEEFKDFIVLGERRNGLTQMHVIRLKDKTAYNIDFGEASYAAYFAAERRIR